MTGHFHLLERVLLVPRWSSFKSSASSVSSAVLILKVFAACDDFDSEKQPPACAFPCVLCAPCVLCGEGFWLRLRYAAFQGLGSCSQADQKGGPTLQPQKTSASSATSAFQGFDPGFGCGSIALRFRVCGS